MLVLVVAAIGIVLMTSATTTTPIATTTRHDPEQHHHHDNHRAQPRRKASCSACSRRLPGGVCKPTTPKPYSIWVNALAMVDCGQNTNEGGPTRAVYGLFADVDALNKAFTDDIGADGSQLMNCPGEGPSPDGWHYQGPERDRRPDRLRHLQEPAQRGLEQRAKLTLSDVFGDARTIDDLHTWWGKYWLTTPPSSDADSHAGDFCARCCVCWPALCLQGLDIVGRVAGFVWRGQR